MQEKWRRFFENWSKLDQFKQKVQSAKRIIDIARTRRTYLAFSGGKDSTVLLHLASKAFPVVHWYAGAYYIPDEIHKEIQEIALKYSRVYIEMTSPEYFKKKRKAINVKGRKFLGIELRHLRKHYDTAILGIRAEESVKRKLKGWKEHDKGFLNLYPLWNWSWEDVWAYIVSRKVPYISYYDKCGDVVGYDNVRFTALFYPGFDKFGAENVDGVLFWRFKNADVFG